MARNIESKARCADLQRARAIAVRLGAVAHAVERQTDRYFVLDGGRRVKLRVIDGGRAELIEYQRPESAGVRASDYTVTPVRDDTAGVCLVPKGPPLVVVRKQREILLLDNVRIHFDAVDGLGTFVELEAVVDERHDDATCRAQLAALITALAIAETDLIAASYAELLQRGGVPPRGQSRNDER